MKLMSKYFPHISGRSEERDVRSGLQTEAERLSVLLLTLSETGLHQLRCGKRGVCCCRNVYKTGRFGGSGASEFAPNTRLHRGSKVTGSFAGLQMRLSLCPLGLFNSSKGFLVLHILCSLSSQALNCFPLGAACMRGSPAPWQLSTRLFWQLKSTVRSLIPRSASQKVAVAIPCRVPKY